MMSPILSLQDLILGARAERAQVLEWVALGLIEPRSAAEDPDAWRFGPQALTCVARVTRLAREFELTPHAAALVYELLDERRRLTERVQVLERLVGAGA